MNSEAIALGLAAVFAGLTAVTVAAGLAISPAMLILGLPFGGVSYMLWYHGSGRLASRMQEGGRVGGQSRRGRSRHRGNSAGDDSGAKAQSNRRQTRGDPRDRAPKSSSGLSRTEAYRRLDLKPGASQDDVHDAFREKAKRFHPDTDGGDEETFKKVNRAYEQLTE